MPVNLTSQCPRSHSFRLTAILPCAHPSTHLLLLQVILGCSAKIFPDEWRERAGPVLDFFSSSVATLVCSVVSTPQMVITDRESSPESGYSSSSV